MRLPIPLAFSQREKKNSVLKISEKRMKNVFGKNERIPNSSYECLKEGYLNIGKKFVKWLMNM
jgi:hypothetical protein